MSGLYRLLDGEGRYLWERAAYLTGKHLLCFGPDRSIAVSRHFFGLEGVGREIAAILVVSMAQLLCN